MDRDPSLLSTMRVLALDRATGQAVDALQSAGIRSLLLKGPALSRWLYEDESQRPYVDIDLLVDPATLDRAEQVLNHAGFRRMGLDTLPTDRPKYAVTLRRSDNGLAVDLHHALLGAEGDEPTQWVELSRDTTTIEVGGFPVEVLGQPGRALVLALHAAKDGARSPHVLIDVQRAVELVPEEVWRQSAELAERIRATDGFATGLRRVAAGAALAERLGLSTRVRAEFVLTDKRPPPLAMGALWFLKERGIHRRASVAFHKLFPSRDFLRAWRPIARRGRLGLLVTYAWRPVWVLWRAGPAVVAARRAARAERRSRAGDREPD
jgi:hypothetical protein